MNQTRNPMSTTRTSIARLAAASVLALGLGALGAGPALAEDSPSSWFYTDSASSSSSYDDSSPDRVRSVQDGATAGGEQSPNDGSSRAG